MEKVMYEGQGKNALLTIEEAAAHLGIRPSTIRSWIWRKQHLEFVKVGRLIRITRRSIDEFIERNTIPRKEVENG